MAVNQTSNHGPLFHIPAYANGPHQKQAINYGGPQAQTKSLSEYVAGLVDNEPHHVVIYNPKA